MNKFNDSGEDHKGRIPIKATVPQISLMPEEEIKEEYVFNRLDSVENSLF